MIQHSTTITKLMGAMLKVQGVVDSVQKDKKNPAFKSAYATLGSVVDAIRPACQENGLVVMQAPGAFREGVIAVETFIVHAESGEWIKSALELPLAKVDPQGAGSAITYAERYSLMALFNLPPVDDDGNDASRRPEPVRVVSAIPAEGAPVPAMRSLAEELCRMVRQCGSIDALEALRSDLVFKGDFKELPLALQATVGEVIKAKRRQLGEAA